jgi:hypothetical protein
MDVIWKHELAAGFTHTHLQLTKGAKVLFVAAQALGAQPEFSHDVFIWEQHDATQEEMELRTFVAIPTGMDFDSSDLEYVGSTSFMNDPRELLPHIVVHVYEQH